MELPIISRDIINLIAETIKAENKTKNYILFHFDDTNGNDFLVTKICPDNSKDIICAFHIFFYNRNGHQICIKDIKYRNGGIVLANGYNDITFHKDVFEISIIKMAAILEESCGEEFIKIKEISGTFFIHCEMTFGNRDFILEEEMPPLPLNSKKAAIIEEYLREKCKKCGIIYLNAGDKQIADIFDKESHCRFYELIDNISEYFILGV